jgi:hypothetical protein
MGRPLKVKKSATKDIGFNSFSHSEHPVFPGTMSSSEFFNVVGGTVASASYPVTKVRVKIGANAESDGWIVRQKGAIKYLVTDGTNVGICVLADSDDGSLADNTMTITYDVGDSAVTRVARLTNRWALGFNGQRYLVNFFDGGSTAIKSGTRGVTVVLAQIENYTA